jgi:hypothetical protein
VPKNHVLTKRRVFGELGRQRERARGAPLLVYDIPPEIDSMTKGKMVALAHESAIIEEKRVKQLP